MLKLKTRMTLPAVGLGLSLTVASFPLMMSIAAGTSREYPIEKLLRDARSAQIEDGENYMLTMRLGLLAQHLYAEGWTQD